MSAIGGIEGRAVAGTETGELADRGVLRFITAGSVDDGKSSLIGRLLHDSQAVLEDQFAAVERASKKRGFDYTDLSLLTDGLEAEREQGITIDVAYRYFATARRKFIIADTPGHEQYTRNMVTGASTADAAVILLDARKGLLPQSRRHLLIAHLLGIRHVIVAVNKMDLVGYEYEVFKTARNALEAFSTPLAIPDLQFIPVSALNGDMVVERRDHIDWYDGPTLLEALEAIRTEDVTAASPFRFPVQLVARLDDKLGGRGYMGRVAAGIVFPGSEVVALPSGRRTQVREIRVLDELRTVALPGDSVTITLAEEIDISRGDLLAAPDELPRSAKTISARLCWLANEPLDPAARYLLRHTTRTVKAKVAKVIGRVDIQSLDVAASGTIGMNDIFDAALNLAQPVFADAYARNRTTGAFILIDEATHQTVAAGMISDDWAQRHALASARAPIVPVKILPRAAAPS